VTADTLRLALLSKGSMVSRYRLGKPLGRGGHGVVFEAFDTQDAVHVAIKLLEVELANPASRTALDRFAMEVNAIRRVRHPNVVQVYESGHIKTQHHVLAFYTMEILDGRPLDKLVREKGSMPPEQALSVVRQAAAGLHRAHVENVIHRDVKPANIFLTSQGRAVVMDFGVCKLNDLATGVTLVGQVVGTPRYLAPEQLLDGAVDARTDVFALGVVLFYLLTGTHLRPEPDLKTAFQAITSNADVRRVKEHRHIPEELKDVLTTALSLQQDARFESARALGEALEATQLLLHHEAVTTELVHGGEDGGTGPADATSRDLSLRSAGLVESQPGAGDAQGPALPQHAPTASAAVAPPARPPVRVSATASPVVLFCPQCGTRLRPDQDLAQHLEQCPAPLEAKAAPPASETATRTAPPQADFARPVTRAGQPPAAFSKPPTGGGTPSAAPRPAAAAPDSEAFGKPRSRVVVVIPPPAQPAAPPPDTFGSPRSKVVVHPPPAPPAPPRDAPPEAPLDAPRDAPGRDWDLGTPGGLLGVVGALCPDCGAELENAEELGRHARLCPGRASSKASTPDPGDKWLNEVSAVSNSLPALVGTRLLEDPPPPLEEDQVPDDAPLELDLSGSGSKARNWTGRDARGTGAAVNQHVSNLYTAANRIKQTALQRNVGTGLDLMAPLSALVHDHVLEATLFSQCLQALMFCASRLVDAALAHDSIQGMPRRQPVARLEARLQELTSGKVFEDRELQKVVRGQLEVARGQERQMAEAMAALEAGIAVLRAQQPQVLAALEVAHRRPRQETEAAAVAMVKQLHAALFPG
jgi:hypothetical protein